MNDSEVRRRVATDGDSKTESTNDGSRHASQTARSENTGFSILDVLRIVLGLVLLSSLLSWFVTGSNFFWGYKPWFSNLSAVKSWLNGPIYLTDAELAVFDGTDPTKPIYVGLNGSIYDVSASAHTYGPGGSYSFFAGKDAARSFITGCFKEDQTPDLRGVENMYIPVDSPDAPPLTKGQLKIRKERDLRVAKKRVREGIEGWQKVFSGETDKPYFWVGEIKREEGWLEALPLRELCEQAEKSRPKREDVDKGDVTI